MKKNSIGVALFILLVATLQANSFNTEILKAKEKNDKTEVSSFFEKNSFNPQIALSSEYYPVTPGDVYTLAFIAGNTPVTYTILVDTSYRIRVANLAQLDARGMSFTTLKERVETIINKNYPLSGVQFGISSPSIFRIRVKGEVKKTAEQEAWALSRLSDVIASHYTAYSSIRDVSVTSVSGTTASYDLFQATRFGDISQNPLVRPGDIVTVNRVNRLVTIAGAVERPGEYQLLPGEGLFDLVNIYASGLTPLADDSRMDLVRYVKSSHLAGEKIFITNDDILANFELQNFDRITVKEISDLLPVMFMEGAIASLDLNDTSVSPDTSTRMQVRFNQGENYASLVRSYRSSFSAVSDTANAYIIRGEKQIALNLNPMLYDASFTSDYLVEKNDVLIIPFRQYFVTVSGAVFKPGRYPYIPDRDWSYYVSLAGGLNTLMNSRESIHITDIYGTKHSKKDPITPETVIEAKANAFLFYFNQYAPVITTTLSVISTFLTLSMLLAN